MLFISIPSFHKDLRLSSTLSLRLGFYITVDGKVQCLCLTKATRSKYNQSVWGSNMKKLNSKLINGHAAKKH